MTPRQQHLLWRGARPSRGVLVLASSDHAPVPVHALVQGLPIESPCNAEPWKRYQMYTYTSKVIVLPRDLVR
jgi:hypothetical protein